MNPLEKYTIDEVEVLLKKCERCERLTAAKYCCKKCSESCGHSISCDERNLYRAHFLKGDNGTRENVSGTGSV